jgi:hypothetical protein
MALSSRGGGPEGLARSALPRVRRSSEGPRLGFLLRALAGLLPSLGALLGLRFAVPLALRLVVAVVRQLVQQRRAHLRVAEDAGPLAVV